MESNQRNWKYSSSYSKISNPHDKWEKEGKFADSKLQKLWNEYKDSMQKYSSQSKWYLVEIDWFNHWAYKNNISISGQPKVFMPEYKNNLERIENEKLLVDPHSLFKELYHDISSEFYNHTIHNWSGRLLKDKIVQSEHYVLVTEGLFEYLKRKYKCDYSILRYENNKELKSIGESVEVQLTKIFIMEVPKDKTQKNYEIIQISRNDPVDRLYSRIKESRDSNDFRIWKTEMPNMQFNTFHKKLSTEYKQNK